MHHRDVPSTIQCTINQYICNHHHQACLLQTKLQIATLSVKHEAHVTTVMLVINQNYDKITNQNISKQEYRID